MVVNLDEIQQIRLILEILSQSQQVEKFDTVIKSKIKEYANKFSSVLVTPNYGFFTTPPVTFYDRSVICSKVFIEKLIY